MESLDDEEVNVFLMENHQDGDVPSHFSYQDFLCICKKLIKETSKLEKIVSVSKNTIYSLKYKIKNLVKEIKNIRERENDLVQNSSP